MVHEHELLWTRLVFGAHMVKWNQVASQRSAYTGGDAVCKTLPVSVLDGKTVTAVDNGYYM